MYNSEALSANVTAGSNDANAEFVAEIGNLLNIQNISSQIAKLGKVYQYGEETIAFILAN